MPLAGGPKPDDLFDAEALVAMSADATTRATKKRMADENLDIQQAVASEQARHPTTVLAVQQSTAKPDDEIDLDALLSLAMPLATE